MLAAMATMTVLALSGCGGAGKAVEAQHRREHPCEFSATSKQCAEEEHTETTGEQAHHETGKLRERARVESERARLKREAGG
jgi:hypothetical protein